MSLTSYQTAPPRVLKGLVCGAKSRMQTQTRYAAQLRSNDAHVLLNQWRGPEKFWSARRAGRIPDLCERWYPKGMPARARLPFYAQHFEMVEVNSTFYSVPDARMVERWAQSTPNEFIFDVKLHQLLSRHATAAKFLPPSLKRRAEIDAKGKVKLTPEIEEAMVKEILKSIAMLQASGKLGVLLLQLSPAFSPRKHSLGELQSLVGVAA